MSRSHRKPIVKDKGYKKRSYWKTIRRTWNISYKKIAKSLTESGSFNWWIGYDEDEKYYKSEELKSIEKDIYEADLTLKNPKEIINDYDYCDYILMETKNPKAERK